MTAHRQRRHTRFTQTTCLLFLCGLLASHELPGNAGELASVESHALLFRANDFPKGWTHHSAQNGTPLSDTWIGRKGVTELEDVLICTGRPAGYLRTREMYDNFEFSMEWRYPNFPHANSGILIHTSGADKIWPRSIQVQLHRPMAGSIFPTGGARSANRIHVNHLKLPVNKWHKCIVTCKDGTVAVWINGVKAGEVTECEPRSGCIALQSEGQEIHFRRIMIRRQPQ